MRKVISTAALCLASTSMAFAQGAILQDKTGTVLVNAGNGFVAADEGAVLAATDMVTIKPHAVAFLAYKDGCRTKLVPGRTVRVGATACAEGRELADLPEAVPVPAPEPIVPVADPGIGAPLIAGIVVEGAGIGAAVALASRNTNFPVTPRPPRPTPVSP